MRVRRAAAIALLPFVLVTACSDDKDKEGADAGKSCEGLLKSADSAAALPADIPAGVDGATFFEVQTQGATKRYFAYLNGTDLVGTRDKVRTAFESGGYQIVGSDNEEGAEAEFEWTGKGKEGSFQVIPYCKDHIRVRYRVGPQ